MGDHWITLGYFVLIVICAKCADRLGEWLSSPTISVPSKEWRDMVDPIVKKCRLSATFGGQTQFNQDGSKALAELLDKMANELDRRS